MQRIASLGIALWRWPSLTAAAFFCAVAAGGESGLGLQILKTHGEHCSANATLTLKPDGEQHKLGISFDRFRSHTVNHYRTACQVISRLELSRNARLELTLVNLYGKAVLPDAKNASALFSVFVSMTPGQAADQRIDFARSVTGDGGFGPAGVFESSALLEATPHRLTTACGVKGLLNIKAAIFYKGESGKDSDGILSLDRDSIGALSEDAILFRARLVPCP